MTRAARILFGVLIVATVAAFFVAQRLKHQPAVIQMDRGGGFTRVFSPNGDGRRDLFTLRFRLKRTTKVTVEVVAMNGARVTTLAKNRDAQKYKLVRLQWDGKDEAGRTLRHGRYKLKFVLSDEGRSVVWPTSFQLDTVPPRPKVLRVTADGVASASGPAILPATDGGGAEAELSLRGWKPVARVVRTSPGPQEVVARLPVRVTRTAPGGTRVVGRLRAIAGTATWDGRAADGSPAPAGTYVIQACVRDAAQILGCGPTAGPNGLPVPEPSGRMRGHGGITVRHVAVQATPVPIKAGHRFTFFVDSRGKRYRWVLRRVGSRKPVDSGTGAKPALKVGTGSVRGAAYRLAVSVGGHRVEVPALSNDARKQPVLVVLPGITWQGLNALDDDGDGLANSLQAGAGPRASRIRTARVLGALPAAFDADVQPVLEWLARQRKRFEITTDLALAQQSGPDDRSSGPQLEGHRGVLLVGEARWTTPAAAKRLRRFVADGHTAVTLNPAGLHRPVSIAGDERRGFRLAQPGPFDPSDAFGVTSRGAVRLDGPPQNDRDEIGLFSGTDGRFDGYAVGWPAESLGDGRRVASAVDRSDHVIVAGARIGKGILVRTGLPTFAARLRTDSDTSELMGSAWRRLSR